MKCKERFIKLFAILIIGLFAVSLSLTGINNAVDPKKAQFVSDSICLNDGHCVPREVWGNSDVRTSNLMDRVFQIIFILFIISPPLIVILLFLIWRELKTRNKLR